MSDPHAALVEFATFLLFLGAIFTGHVALIWLVSLARLARARQDARQTSVSLAILPMASDPLALALARAWPAEQEVALPATLEAA